MSNQDTLGFPIPLASLETYQAWALNYDLTLERRFTRWQEIFPPGSFFDRSRILQRFIQKGIPPQRRPEVWLAVSGAAKLMSENVDLYDKLCSAETPLSQAVENQITCDLPRTFPENQMFQSLAVDSLKRILTAAARYLEDVGYCQGMNIITGQLLLAFARANNGNMCSKTIILKASDFVSSPSFKNLKTILFIVFFSFFFHRQNFDTERKIFFLLLVIVQNILADYFTPQMSGLIRDMNVVTKLLANRDRALTRHLQRQHLPLGAVISRWLVTGLANCLPNETVFRIWDGMFYDGAKVVIGAVLNLIILHRQRLLSTHDPSSTVLAFNSVTEMSPITLDCHAFAASLYSNNFVKLIGRPKSHVSRNTLKQLRETTEAVVA